MSRLRLAWQRRKVLVWLGKDEIKSLFYGIEILFWVFFGIPLVVLIAILLSTAGWIGLRLMFL